MTPYYIRRLVSELKQRENQDNACSTFTTNDIVHPAREAASRRGHRQVWAKRQERTWENVWRCEERRRDARQNPNSELFTIAEGIGQLLLCFVCFWWLYSSACLSRKAKLVSILISKPFFNTVATNSTTCKCDKTDCDVYKPQKIARKCFSATASYLTQLLVRMDTFSTLAKKLPRITDHL